MVVNVSRRADLLDMPTVHHDDLVGECLGLFLIMRDDDGGDAERALQPDELNLQIESQRAVERGERLIEQQQRWVDRQRARDRNALLLAARELPRQTPLQPLELYGGEEFVDAGSFASLSRPRKDSG